MSREYVDPRRANQEKAWANLRSRLRDVFSVFDDPDVTEIRINGPDRVFITKHARREPFRIEGLTETKLVSALREVASAMGQDAIAESDSAMVHGKMPGLRFAGCLSPTSSFGTSMVIRKHFPRVLSLEDYVRSGQITEKVAAFLSAQVAAGSNIIIAGGTDSGKTTFLNALSREIPRDEGVITIEDTRELSLLVPNWLALEYNKQVGITPSSCLDFCMRASPDRIILGELKDEVAAQFLEAGNTGHHGLMATTHADSAAKGLSRVELLTLRADLGWPLEAIRQTVADTLHLAIHLRKRDGRREISEITRVLGCSRETGEYRLEHLLNLDHPELVVGENLGDLSIR